MARRLDAEAVVRVDRVGGRTPADFKLRLSRTGRFLFMERCCGSCANAMAVPFKNLLSL